MINLLLIRVEYELLNNIFHNFYLFIRYFLFSTFNDSFHFLQICIFVIFLRFLRFCVELLTVDMRKVFFELFALLILIGQLKIVVELQVDLTEDLVFEDWAKDVFNEYFFRARLQLAATSAPRRLWLSFTLFFIYRPETLPSFDDQISFNCVAFLFNFVVTLALKLFKQVKFF